MATRRSRRVAQQQAPAPVQLRSNLQVTRDSYGWKYRKMAYGGWLPHSSRGAARADYGPRGIATPAGSGNRCYQHVVHQSLMHTPVFLHWILTHSVDSTSPPHEENGCVMCWYRRLTVVYWKNYNKTADDPIDETIFDNYNGTANLNQLPSMADDAMPFDFPLDRTGDAAQFHGWVVDNMEMTPPPESTEAELTQWWANNQEQSEHWNAEREALFFIDYEETRTCKVCGLQRVLNLSTKSLVLQVTETTQDLDDLLDTWSHDSDEDRCVPCWASIKSITEHDVRRRIVAAPQVLCIQLAVNHWIGRKLTRFVHDWDIPDHFNLQARQLVDRLPLDYTLSTAIAHGEDFGVNYDNLKNIKPNVEQVVVQMAAKNDQNAMVEKAKNIREAKEEEEKKEGLKKRKRKDRDDKEGTSKKKKKKGGEKKKSAETATLSTIQDEPCIPETQSPLCVLGLQSPRIEVTEDEVDRFIFETLLHRKEDHADDVSQQDDMSEEDSLEEQEGEEMPDSSELNLVDETTVSILQTSSSVIEPYFEAPGQGYSSHFTYQAATEPAQIPSSDTIFPSTAGTLQHEAQIERGEGIFMELMAEVEAGEGQNAQEMSESSEASSSPPLSSPLRGLIKIVEQEDIAGTYAGVDTPPDFTPTPAMRGVVKGKKGIFRGLSSSAIKKVVEIPNSSTGSEVSTGSVTSPSGLHGLSSLGIKKPKEIPNSSTGSELSSSSLPGISSSATKNVVEVTTSSTGSRQSTSTGPTPPSPSGLSGLGIKKLKEVANSSLSSGVSPSSLRGLTSSAIKNLLGIQSSSSGSGPSPSGEAHPSDEANPIDEASTSSQDSSSEPEEPSSEDETLAQGTAPSQPLTVGLPVNLARIDRTFCTTLNNQILTDGPTHYIANVLGPRGDHHISDEHHMPIAHSELRHSTQEPRDVCLRDMGYQVIFLTYTRDRLKGTAKELDRL